MITRCCKWLCHKYSNDEKLDASHLGVIAGLYLSLVVKNDNGSVFTPECKLNAGCDPAHPRYARNRILAPDDFLRTLCA